MFMFYKILEDASPYYVRFTHIGIENIKKLCLEYVSNISFTSGFTHYRYPANKAIKILNKVPLSKKVWFDQNRVSMFVTNPGHYYNPHKDGTTTWYGLNYPIQVLDDKCEVSWYSDEDCKGYTFEPDLYYRGVGRECMGFDKTKYKPLKTLKAFENECILFNTEIFHDFDNTKSPNTRMLLTLRDAKPKEVTYDDVKKIIFNT